MNKYLRSHSLFPTKGLVALRRFQRDTDQRHHHKVYSFRHSFEDRMKEGWSRPGATQAPDGHTVDRPKYGEGGSLEWRQRELKKVALTFDPAIV